MFTKFSSPRPDRLLSPPSLLSNGDSFSGAKRPRREDDHTYSSSVEVKNA